MTKLSDTVAPKQFDKTTSPFHLLFYLDSKFTIREFPQLSDLAKFVKQLSLTWGEYGIIHGEIVKELPQHDLDEDVPDDELDQPESGLQTLSPEEAEKLRSDDN